MTLSDDLQVLLQQESLKFQDYYLWLQNEMPKVFFEEVTNDDVILIVHTLISFPLQEYFSNIRLKDAAISICLDSPDADLKILKEYAYYGIKNYQAYLSKTAAPFADVTASLRITVIHFTGAKESDEKQYPEAAQYTLRSLIQQRNPLVTDDEFNDLLTAMSPRFLRTLSTERLLLALNMFFRAKTRDNCQYEVRYNEDWEESGAPSMQIVLAWRNTPKHNFLYRLARIVHRHGLIMRFVNASYIDPYKEQNILVMSLGIHGSNGKAVWDVANILDFLREFVTTKYFASFDTIDEKLVSKSFVSGIMGNFLRSVVSFVHQCLVHVDPNLYSLENIEEALCRHPELTQALCRAFSYRFDPWNHNFGNYLEVREAFLGDVDKIDTGQFVNDMRRKNVLKMAMSFVHHTLKTNFFRINFTALCFRLSPQFLDNIPFDRSKKFPELPFAIFFMKGMHFIGFHIRFSDLARGGVRTIYPEVHERMVVERNNVFIECYNLAYTQQKKNKEIPEGGAKAIIFVWPFNRLDSEALILKKELQLQGLEAEAIEEQMQYFRREQKLEYLYMAQRAFVESLITIVNCDAEGKLRAKHMLDYWRRPEYIYLGPDENMHNSMIEWIAAFSQKYHYKPGSSFISGKPSVGINHKKYGVTSLGVNVYMEAILKHLDIDPKSDLFIVKMSGGPSGDVAGNQILNLYRLYPQTAKIVALTDGSGTIYDPQGLDLQILSQLFVQQKPIKYYPPEKLADEGFLLDRDARRSKTALETQMLCRRKRNGEVFEDWLGGNEMNFLFRSNLNNVKSDIFIPAGGRPRTLNEHNVREFLDETAKPTAKAIIEGANLYLTDEARSFLEERGVLIVKDSSANKTGVICSSFEVLCGLTLGDDKFLQHKDTLVQQIEVRLQRCASNEANLLLQTYLDKGRPLTEISDRISSRINMFAYQILDHLEAISFPTDQEHPLVKCYLSYCLPLLRDQYCQELLQRIPDLHKKAVVASHIAAQLVYQRGLDWHPTIVDILPLILQAHNPFFDVD